MKAAAHAYLYEKTDGKKSLRKLRSLAGGNYRHNEVAWEDDFHHPYVGKKYPDGYTEVFSMGMQEFAFPESMLILYLKDKILFETMAGVCVEKPLSAEARKEKSDVIASKAQEKENKKALIGKFNDKLKRKAKKDGEFWKGTPYSFDGRGKVWLIQVERGDIENASMDYERGESLAKALVYLCILYRQFTGNDYPRVSYAHPYPSFESLLKKKYLLLEKEKYQQPQKDLQWLRDLILSGDPIPDIQNV